MNRQEIGKNFHNALFSQHCILIHPENDEILDPDHDVSITPSDDDYAMYLKVALRDRMIGSNQPKAPEAFLYIYAENFLEYSLTQKTSSVSNMLHAARPLSKEYEFYDLKIKMNASALASKKVSLGVPEFAHALRETVIGNEIVRLGFYANKNIHSALRNLQIQFQKEKHESPWDKFPGLSKVTNTKDLGAFEVKKGLRLRDLGRSSTGYRPQITFPSFKHYATVQSIGTKLESEFRNQDVVKFENMYHDFLLIEQPESPEKYLGILKFTSSDKIRLRSNDKVKIKLVQSTGLESVPIHARVLESSPSLPKDAKSFIITWPKTKGDAPYATKNVPIVTRQSMLQTGTRTSHIIQSRLFRTHKMKIGVDLCQNDELRQNLKALSNFDDFQAEDEDSTCSEESFMSAFTQQSSLEEGPLSTGEPSLSSQWKEILCAARLDSLPKNDIFCDIRTQFPRPETFMNLNESQRRAIEHGEHANGRLLNIHGPPGTGKTTIICACAKLYFQIEEQCQVVALSTTNFSVDAIAEKMQTDLTVLQRGNEAQRDKYVVRLHSDEAEMSIFLEPVRSARKALRKARDGQLGRQKSGALKLSEAEKLITDHIALSNNYRSQYIDDDRVSLKKLSAGHRMLQAIGKASGDLNEKIRKDHEDLATLYEICEQVKDDSTFANKFKLLRQKATKLYEAIVGGASAVVATVGRLAMPSMMDHCRDRVNIIFIDEASRVDEATMWPIMATRYAKLKGLILVGDPYQLRSLVTSTPATNVFCEQKKATLPERLLAVGFPTFLMDTQMRMVPEIAEASANLIYEGKLVNGPGTAHSDRPLVQALVAHNLEKWQKASPLIYFDFQKSSECWTERIENNGSRRNPFFIKKAFNEIECLLHKFPKATMAFATPYSKDFQLAKTCRAEMVASDEFPNIDNFKVVTWDTCQGLEFDIGFVVLPLIPYSRSFAHEKGRVNVISTRWRCGMYVFANTYSVERSGPVEIQGYEEDDWLNMFRSRYWEKNKVKVWDTDSQPNCRWFKDRN